MCKHFRLLRNRIPETKHIAFLFCGVILEFIEKLLHILPRLPGLTEIIDWRITIGILIPPHLYP